MVAKTLSKVAMMRALSVTTLPKVATTPAPAARRINETRPRRLRRWFSR